MKMRISAKTMAIVYFIMGFLFVYMAVQSSGKVGWSFITILWAIIATLDFGVALKLTRTHFRYKKKKKE